jgi:SSS family solute:Na+ symporter
MTLFSSLIFVGTSLFTTKPFGSQVAAVTWSRTFWRNESTQLKNLPWYRNYRYQSMGLLVVALIIVVAWW